ncbi:MAG: alpha/beta hydrolase [Inquilinus sp.]|nr:alpha/beta hydrolase [Inquilinus sp.]
MARNGHQGFGTIFSTLDAMRRAQARGLAVLGFGPAEHGHRVVASGPLWRLRRYAGPNVGPLVLIVAAPIKRPYIWDLAPTASAVRYCLQQGLRLYLLEWSPPSRRTGACGLAEYADDAMAEAVAALAEDAGAEMPVLMGHSLGGTFAAIFAALHPERLSGLVLLSAPLCLPPGVSPFRDALAAMPVSWLSEMEIVPGSLLTQVSAMASPATFVWSRVVDAAASAADRRAAEIRPRVEHWALNEVALPRKLVRDILQGLYRENRLCAGTLEIHGRVVRPGDLSLPTLAVANAGDEVAPPAAVAPFLEAMAGAETRLIDYPGEAGIVLQHLGILLGRDAFARIWPEIVAWIRAGG